MKKYLTPFCLLLYTAFAILLLFQLSKQHLDPTWQELSARGAFQKYQGSDSFVIHQDSNKAIINVDTPDFAEAVYSGKMEIVCSQPNSSTLIKIVTGQPSIINSTLNDSTKIPFVKSNGKVVIVNDKGIIVRSAAIFNWDEKQGLIAPDIEAGVIELANKQGNVYAMAINKEGGIRASKRPLNMNSGMLIIPDAKDSPVESAGDN